MSETTELQECILRVQKMEGYLNEILGLRMGDKIRIPEDSEYAVKWQELLRYYESGLWLQDYERDEKGELPEKLHRGVLAEDTLWNLICEIEEKSMSEFTVTEMQEMQRELQEKYKHIWEPIEPETGKNKLLWMVGEIGEVADIVKKNGAKKATEDAEIRRHLVEEMADVLMYYNDVMLCYGITPKELKQAYVEKFEKNMKRW